MNCFSCRAKSAQLRQRGYVLVATMVLLALLTLMAARLAGRVDQLRAQSSGLAAYADGLVRSQSARASLLYQLATSYPGPGGYVGLDGRILRADGSPNVLGEGMWVAVQDHRGLLSVNAPDRDSLSRLLYAAGLPEGRSDHLLDTLADYADTDSLSRLNGAEAPAYAERGMPPPRNDWLQSPEELRQIVGWVNYPDVLDRVIPWLSARRDSQFNPNTAPKEVLKARLPQLLPSQLDAILQRRAVRPAAAAGELRDIVGTAFDNDQVSFLVGETLRLTVQDVSLPLAYIYNVMLTPASDLRPWIILDSRTVAAPSRSSVAASIPRDPIVPASY